MCYNFARMKIGIDTFGSDHARSGLGSYLLYLTENVLDIEDVEVEFFGADFDKFTYISGKDISYKSILINNNINAERKWHKTSLKKFVTQQKYDVVIFPAIEKVFPLCFKVPAIAVVNSILFGDSDEKIPIGLRSKLKHSLKKVKKIISASNYIREDLINNGIDECKIEVVYNGIDHKLFHPIIGLSSYIVDLKPFAIKRPYFVYGSRLAGPEKKHIELIKAFALFKEKTNLPHRLVIAGEGPYDSEIQKAIMESSVASDIFLTGYFPHKSFPMMYAGSEACVFPSVNEGVGLQVLEAMATGVPVLCSKSGALPEIASDAAYYFDSDNIEEIATALERIVTDSELRADLTKKGIERAELFDWQVTVNKTFDIAKQILQSE